MTETLYTLFRDHPAVITDSRRVIPGSLFFALRGEQFNGNLFAEAALNQGASFAIVDEPSIKKDSRYILVKDVLASLQQLAAHHRSAFHIPVIGITGTNGKTTTKELITTVLSTQYNTLATKGNFNNHIGVPLTLLNLTPAHQIAVIEMGANHPGEIDFLCSLAQPTHGLITNTGKAHLEGFGSTEGVFQAKTELLRFLKKNHGVMFVNSDDSRLMEVSAEIERMTYGLHSAADLNGDLISSDPFLSLRLIFPNFQKLTLNTRLYGMYNAWNVLAAACIGLKFQVAPRQIIQSIRSYVPSNNRSQISKTGKNLLLLDAYNANPSSTEAAITHFANSHYPEKVLILGDMLELGREAESEHLNMIGLIKSLNFSSVYLIGPLYDKLNPYPDWKTFPDSESAKNWLSANPLINQTILLKGSRGIKLEKLVDHL